MVFSRAMFQAWPGQYLGVAIHCDLTVFRIAKFSNRIANKIALVSNQIFKLGIESPK